MRVFVVVASALMLAIAPISTASAADVTTEDITQALSDRFSVRDYDANTLIVNAAGYSVIIGVRNGDISYLTYIPGIDGDQISLEVLNDFNNNVKFARAYVDDDGDVVIQMDRNSDGGISIDNVKSDFDVFLMVVWTFLNELEKQRIA
ncbi:MAG TPA: YbjN domain-containing protein [Hyphomicrobiales bacterium]|nr:YbjN domain-containing protein [Hyphomicrobiales bacterium]